MKAKDPFQVDLWQRYSKFPVRASL